LSHPGIGRGLKGMAIPSSDPHRIKGRVLEDNTCREGSSKVRSRHLESSLVDEAWRDLMGYVSETDLFSCIPRIHPVRVGGLLFLG